MARKNAVTPTDKPGKHEAVKRGIAVLIHVFQKAYRSGSVSVSFERQQLREAAQELGFKSIENIGAAIYDYRYRREFPQEIKSTAPDGYSWVIMPAGKSKYRFELIEGSPFIVPRSDASAIKIPDSTPEIIRHNRQDDEQALLARIRYNRLIDTFLGITAYSLQNHLRTTVKGMGQIETDELYVGVNRHGQQFVIPVQAKGRSDLLAVVQTMQDVACCRENEKFSKLTCRSVSAQFLNDDVVALFELTQELRSIRVVDERHYRLVPADQISHEDLSRYSSH